MELNVKTLTLQSLLSKSVKGASNNKMIPITSFLDIQLKNNKLTITSTDATNYLQVIEPKVEGEDFRVTVVADTFNKLIQKISTPYTKLTVDTETSSLNIEGNGSYTLELPVDEEDNLINLPDVKIKKGEGTKVKSAIIRQIANVNKAAVADTLEIPMLTGYYFNENGTYTTNQFKVCANEVAVLPSSVLVPSTIMDLLHLIDSDDVTIKHEGNLIQFVSDTVIISGHVLDGVEDYPIEAINSFVSLEFPSMAQLPRQLLLDVIERLNLMISSYDKNTIYLTFTKDGLKITSKRSNGTEAINYQGSDNFKPFTCAVDIELLKSQLQAQTEEVVNLWYGHDTALKMSFGKVTQVISLLEDERVSIGEA